MNETPIFPYLIAAQSFDLIFNLFNFFLYTYFFKNRNNLSILVNFIFIY